MKGLLIFDLDGTLLCSQHHICAAARDTLGELGIAPQSDAEILAHLGEPSEEFCRNIAPQAPDLKAFRLRFRTNEQKALIQQGRLFDGIVPLLKRLSDDGFQLAVCSNASIDYVELALRATGIQHYFSQIVSASEQPSKAQAVQTMLAFIEHAFAILIGDTQFDAEAAAAHHIPFIAARYGYGGHALDGAHYSAETPDDIQSQIRRITASLQIN